MDEKEILLREHFEKRFGKIVTISMKEVYEFIEDEIDEGYSESDIVIFMYKIYRDDYIDINSLKRVIEYLGRELPRQMEYHGEKAKTIIHELSDKVESEPELIRRLFFDYQIGKFDTDILRICATLMGYHLSDEFEELPEEEKKDALWVHTKDGGSQVVKDEVADFIRCFTGIINVDDSCLFIPTTVYFSPIDFVDDYMKQNNIKKSVLTKTGIDRRYKSGLKYKGLNKKLDAYRFIIALDMPTQVAKQFLTLCGFAFSPLQRIDLFMLDYLNGKYQKESSFQEFANKYNNLFIEAYGEVFEWPYWE